MLSSELDFFLPPELIAQTPAEPRDDARLLHVRRGVALENALCHYRVRDLPALLREGDLLVFNDTRVLRARLQGRKVSGGKVEMLLLKEYSRNVWEALLKPSARLREGGAVLFEKDKQTITARLEQRLDESWRVRFELSGGDIREYLSELGQVPVPPYIKSAPREEQYQTVYSRNRGESQNPLDSAAAPTAGLHFTPDLLARIQARGVQTAFVTLGVGVGTFRPIQTETLEAHAMHVEEFEVSEETAQLINSQKQAGRRVIAVGTTTTRVLESIAGESGCVRAGMSATSIFLRPGARFRCVDALMTNFHLPRSTLLALVAAFLENGPPQNTDAPCLTGLEILRYAYAQAIAARYRFFSFGDAMLIE